MPERILYICTYKRIGRHKNRKKDVMLIYRGMMMTKARNKKKEEGINTIIKNHRRKTAGNEERRNHAHINVRAYIYTYI